MTAPGRWRSERTTPGLAELFGPAATDLWERRLTRRYRRGATLLRAGEPGDSLHLVMEGHVLVTVPLATGAGAAIGIRGPDETVGELGAILDGHVRTADVTALEDTVTCIFLRAVVDEARRGTPELDRALLDAVARRLSAATAQVAELVGLRAPERLVQVLLRLVVTYGGDGRAEIPLGQDLIGRLAGTDRTKANAVLRDLAEAGIVERGQRGRVVVRDLAALRSLAATALDGRTRTAPSGGHR